MCHFLSKEEWRQPLVKIIQCPALKRHVIIIIITIIIITIIIIIIQLLDQSVSVYSRHETYSYLGYVRRRIEAKLINWPFSPLRLAS